MTLVVKHAFVSGVADDPGALAAGEVCPQAHWNAGHALTGTADANQLNANVVQGVVNDTNIQAAISGQSLTFSWAGQLSPPRGGTGLAAYVLGDTIYGSAANTLAALAGNTAATRKFLRQTGTGTVSAAPAWDTILASDVPGSALTGGNDTNVTLTFGGSPTGALLAPTSITLGWSGTLAASRGGFGADVSGQSGVPLFAAGAATFTPTTGSGNFVQATSPTLVTPALGTPASGTLTNCGGLPLTGLATEAAYTIVGNVTGSAASPTAFTIDGLTAKATPASSDELILWDVAGAAIKKATVSALTASSAVSSIAGNTGAFTLSHGLTNSTNDIRIDPGVIRSYLSGLALSTAGSSSTFAVAAGVAVDGTNADFMKLASSLSKTTSAWAVGSGNGSLDTGSIANSTWYHVHLIKRTDTGVVDVLTSLSASSPTMPANYTLSRRIGSMKTDGSAHWTLFIQDGDLFYWDSPVGDVNVTNPGTTASLRTLTVPTGIIVEAIYTFIASAANGSTDSPTGIYVSDPARSDLAASNTINTFYVNSLATTTFGLGCTSRTFTNTSAQIRTRVAASTAGTTIIINTQGWVDRRGRDA